MTFKKISFSIIIPTKDRPELVGESIYSVLNQEYLDFEIVLVDNNFDNKTYDLVRGINSPKINHVKTGGLAMHENWMAGLNAAKGEYTLLLEDKVLLKQGALTYLAELINESQTEIITYEEDSYYDKEISYLSRAKGHQVDIYESKKIMDELLACDFHTFAAIAPRAVNTCFKTELAQTISKTVGLIFAPLAPDYIFCYHMLFCTPTVVHTQVAMTICRFKSLNPPVGYGNGASYFNKTATWFTFLKDQKNEIERHYLNVPIKALIVYNFLLSDFIYVAGLYRKIPIVFDKEKYYKINYLDLSVRASYSVDVKQEIEEWKKALSSEIFKIRISVHASLFKQYLKEPIYPLVRGWQDSRLYQQISMWMGRERWKRDLVNFSGLEECLAAVPVPNLQYFPVNGK